ncbi:MAG TPA: hypothetical protein DIS68_01105 [Lachnospiraceae bacterium]|nr:ChbG/HpnK family deacetylase [Lachnospiraceae bacterium]HBB59245.1 hypothetical protein [Lachnospiraceae bacterium]HCR99396.1 hypothetical protein [Lachnospiraceae bacterium]
MIEYHADDYGMFPGAARRIIKCANEGCLNGVSLMPNGLYLDECMDILKKECTKDIRLAIHFNIMTEKPLSPAEEVPDLLDGAGCFNVTYGKLLKASVIPGMHGRYRKQIKAELSRQIDRCLPYFTEQGSVRIDSHRHFHMVPMVFDVISELVDEKQLDVSYVRIIREKPVFYRGLAGFECFRPVNIIKVMLLDAFSAIDRMRHRKLYECGHSDFASILFSGCMTKKNLGIILKNIENNRKAVKEDIELMFHPGAVTETEDLERISDAEDRKYMSDILREKEAEALLSRG